MCYNKSGDDSMIEHLYINNYKAFKRENVPLNKHTLLVGTNNSGKTTVLEALDLFFNHVMRHDFIIDKQAPVIVEIQLKKKRYRKVFVPPYYKLDFKHCIGDLYDINHYAYLYVPKDIDIPTLLNDILTVNMTERLTTEIQTKVFKIADYIDGVTGNTNYPLFTYQTKYLMDIKTPPYFSKDDCAKAIANITHSKTIIGIDNFENNFNVKHIDALRRYTYQTIFATDDPNVIQTPNSFVAHLLTGQKEEDYEAMHKRIVTNSKTYILVEGKYDVSWFERALELLGRQDDYAVLPCGGSGNIRYVKAQLDKEGIDSIVITDGDTHQFGALKRDIIELYADVDVVNETFNTHFKRMPKRKKTFFKAIYEKDDVVKHILSSWAKHGLTKDNPFVKELQTYL
jgi:AAA15 family ATPase/GTPase